jgi:hypothetical protein
MSLEGVGSKRRDAPSVSGRARTWRKAKCVREQEVVIGGFTEPAGVRRGPALLLGVRGVDASALAPSVAGALAPEAADECFHRKHVGIWAPPALRRVRIRDRRTGAGAVAERLAAESPRTFTAAVAKRDPLAAYARTHQLLPPRVR